MGERTTCCSLVYWGKREVETYGSPPYPLNIMSVGISVPNWRWSFSCVWLCIHRKAQPSTSNQNTALDKWCPASRTLIAIFPLCCAQMAVHAHAAREVQRSWNPGSPAQSQRLGALMNSVRGMLNYKQTIWSLTNHFTQTAMAWQFVSGIMFFSRALKML